MFNVVLVLQGWLLFGIYQQAIEYAHELTDSYAISLAIFNLLVNTVTMILLLPFTKIYTRLLEWLVPSHSVGDNLHIKKIPQSTNILVQPTLYALTLDCRTLLESILEYNYYLFSGEKEISPTAEVPNLVQVVRKFEKSTHIKMYEHIKEIEHQLFATSTRLEQSSLSHDENHWVQKIISLLLTGQRSAKSIKSIYHDWLDLLSSPSPQMQQLAELVTKQNYELYGFWRQQLQN
ncbi:MAG: hypothetical protein H6765_02480 [Candidatus Peribacteria bacterium]|nr:MAG: hypothetical protein H6765_02480 [Candidatus Peribacteria bacterium]